MDNNWQEELVRLRTRLEALAANQHQTWAQEREVIARERGISQEGHEHQHQQQQGVRY